MLFLPLHFKLGTGVRVVCYSLQGGPKPGTRFFIALSARVMRETWRNGIRLARGVGMCEATSDLTAKLRYEAMREMWRHEDYR